MRETNRARRAFEDYFLMGPGRSLRKLVQVYNESSTEKPPTKHFATLGVWSNHHGWQDRVLQREAEISAARMQDIVENAPKTGYAIWQNRVHALGKLAEFIDPLVAIKGLFSPALVREYRALLADIASEMGERVKQIELGGKEGGPITLRVVYDRDDDLPEKAA